MLSSEDSTTDLQENEILFDLEGMDFEEFHEVDNVDEQGESRAGRPERDEDTRTWQLTHQALPRNPNTMATSLVEKLNRIPSDRDGSNDTQFRFCEWSGSQPEIRPEHTVSTSDHPTEGSTMSWGDIGLSRPVLKAISGVLKFANPTRIQRDVIPCAISGKDILATAATGSGKTAAFLLPIIERVLVSPNVATRRKDKETGRITGGRPATRAIVMLPTRELAVQCWSMLKALVTFVPITSALVVGGFDSKEQQNDLTKSPDVIIATPGRLLDHILNSKGVHLDHVDMVVLDEADRLLEMGFNEAITEILKAIPNKTLALKKGKSSESRGKCQTLLFSATLSANVKDLAAFVLSNAVTARIADPTQVVSSLIQEFVKVGKEEFRDCAFFALLESVVHTEDPASGIHGRIIVFFKEKKEAHRLATLAQVFGLSVAELNGNMNQAERLESMADFQSGKRRYLFATDIAARGLDLPNVELVVNYNLPPAMDAETRYIHRVGRTARMGRSGRSITLYTPDEYPVVKRIVKKSVERDVRGKVFERKVPLDLCNVWTHRIHGVRKVLKRIETEEKLEHEIYISARKITKAENMNSHRKSIEQRPQKQWIKDDGKIKKSWTDRSKNSRSKGRASK